MLATLGGPDPSLDLILRRDLLWQKPSSLPESVIDRCRTTHEYWFHLVRQPRYYAALDELREPHAMRPQRRPSGHKQRQRLGAFPAQTWSTSQRAEPDVDGHPLGRMPGSVWSIAAEPLWLPPWADTAHYAAFPTEWPRRLIMGWSPPGICLQCGLGRIPVVERELHRLRPGDQAGRAALNGESVHGSDQRAGTHVSATARIIGYACACTPHTDHPGTGEPSGPDRRYGDHLGAHGYPLNTNGQPRDTTHPGHAGLWDRPRVGPWREYHVDRWTPPPTRPAVVLDPFGGTGTTAHVARALGRIGISLDLSADYCRLAADPTLAARRAAKVHERTNREMQGTLL
jgi:hypothetical protein